MGDVVGEGVFSRAEDDDNVDDYDEDDQTIVRTDGIIIFELICVPDLPHEKLI